MKRGDIFWVTGGTGPAGKPRPCLIIQRSSTLDDAPKVTVCPITSGVRLGSSVRPLLHPSSNNGLAEVSQVEVDWVFTYNVSRLRARLGSVDDASMRQVDLALQRWLDLE